jgi:hypothetical protein
VGIVVILGVTEKMDRLTLKEFMTLTQVIVTCRQGMGDITMSLLMFLHLFFKDG